MPTSPRVADPAPRSCGDSLGARPGWNELCEATDHLHTAQLLVDDPIATPATALPHLREFWRAIRAAGIAAGLTSADTNEPDAWLESERVGVAKPERQILHDHLRTLAAEPPQNKRELQAQVAAARSLLARLEPEIGGMPLHRRKRQLLWASVTTAAVLAAIALYFMLRVHVPGTGPWRATYYPDKDFEGRPVFVREDDVEHDWEDKAPHEQIAPDRFSVRWDTCLRLDEREQVAVELVANDGARLLIDGETVIDIWDKDPVTGRRGRGRAQLELDAGMHHLRVEYFESFGKAHIELRAAFDGGVSGPFPRDRLSYPGDEFDELGPCSAVH